MNDKILPVYATSTFERTTCVVYIAQKDTMSSDYAKNLNGTPHIVLYVEDLGYAMHILGKFIIE